MTPTYPRCCYPVGQCSYTNFEHNAATWPLAVLAVVVGVTIVSPLLITEICFIRAKYQISLMYVLAYHLLMLAGRGLYWGLWQSEHRGDLQNAAVPITLVVGAMSLFWGMYVYTYDLVLFTCEIIFEIGVNKYSLNFKF